MLENIAIQYVNQSEGTLQLIAFGLLVFGAIVAAIVTRSKVEIERAPYFANSGLIVLAVSTLHIVWLKAIPAMFGGYLWVIMVIWFATYIAAGFSFCNIAMARSRDAYGHGRMAFLAFIPIVSFVLLLKPSKNPISANLVPTIPLLSGGLGVLTGFMLFAASAGVTAYLEGQIKEQVRRMALQARTEPALQQAATKLLIRANGLEETLQRMSTKSPTPITVDDVTTLDRVEADGTQLRRTYIVDLEGMTMTEEFRTHIRNSVCAEPAFEPILRAGGSIREVYVERGGREIGANILTRDECGF